MSCYTWWGGPVFRAQRILVPCEVSLSHLDQLIGREVGPDRDFFPRIEVAAQGVEFLARHPQRVLAEEQVERRVRRFDRLEDRVRRADGVARLLAAQFAQLAADGAGGRGVGGDRAGGTVLRGAPGPPGAEAPRLGE